MKYIREYQLFEASAAAPALTEAQIEWINKCILSGGSWKLNPQTGLVDVEGQFYCHFQGLTDLKGVRFGKVSGDFGCESNQLTSLEGAPQTVDGDFGCNHNQLTSLDGAPQTVGESFSCMYNQLTSLVGAPQKVDGFFECNYNQLTNLEGAPKSVGRDLVCHNNPVSESTLKGIFELTKKGKPYQQALEEFWPDMSDEDRVLIYKQMPNLSPEDVRKYKALATYGNIKNYL